MLLPPPPEIITYIGRCVLGSQSSPSRTVRVVPYAIFYRTTVTGYSVEIGRFVDTTNVEHALGAQRRSVDDNN